MTEPIQFIETKPLDPRLVTKTSLQNVKETLSLAYLMWVAQKMPYAVEYGSISGDNNAIDHAIQVAIHDYLVSALGNEAPSQEELSQWLSKNPLVDSQMESLNAAFELIWHLGSFSFSDTSLPRTAERTGGKRYRKVINYSVNMDILSAIEMADKRAFLSVMLNWVSSGRFANDYSCEERVVKVLTAFAEISFYKTRKGDDATTYTPSGAYEVLALSDDATVELCSSGQEAQGPTRILRSLVKAGLNKYLSDDGSGSVIMSDRVTRDELAEYSRRAKESLALSRIEIKVREEEISLQDGLSGESLDTDNLARNLIYFGAPGTGKSYQLNKQAQRYFPGKSTRVTFHPDYSYAQFVGCFRPFSDVNDKGKHEIGYRYEAGPFLKVYAAAKLHPDEKYLLIIEEINRANTAAVFGDVFQLLDRKKDGSSQYSVEVPDDMKAALIRLHLEMAAKEGVVLEEPEGYLESLEIPSNMYIWATMNSADQGVFPMDSAFKRRWDFQYIGIDDYESEMQSVVVTLANGKKVSWNALRKDINKLLVKSNVNEDKLLGPFFIDAEECEKHGNFVDVFKDKVLLYLYEDAAKTKHKDVFSGDSVTYSTVCGDFNAHGEKVFRGIDYSTSSESDAEFFENK